MVRSENGYVSAKGLANRLKAYEQFYDSKKARDLNLPDDTLITPVTAYGKRIRFKVLEMETLVDSSNLTVDD